MPIARTNLAMTPTSESSSAAKLIVCERTGRWAVALRRELAEAGVRVWETRTLADCRDELVENPASFAVDRTRAERRRAAPSLGKATAAVSRGAAGGRGRSLAGRLRVADARGRRGPFSLFAPAGRPCWPAWRAATWPKCRRRSRVSPNEFGRVCRGDRTLWSPGRSCSGSHARKAVRTFCRWFRSIRRDFGVAKKQHVRKNTPRSATPVMIICRIV